MAAWLQCLPCETVSDELLQPEYAKTFRCIGAECEQNCCCAGWGIYVDKATYKKYRAAPSLRQAAKKFIRINPAASDHFQFALVKIQPDKRCPFLNTTNLCEIQRQHGDEFLSKTCRRYPRALTRLEGKIQRALFLSCPEAARLVLLSSQLLPTPEQPFCQRAVSPDGWNGVETETRLMTRSLQAMAVDVLRDHSYPLWQRLFLLGTICRRSREFPAGQVKWKLPALPNTAGH